MAITSLFFALQRSGDNSCPSDPYLTASMALFTRRIQNLVRLSVEPGVSPGSFHRDGRPTRLDPAGEFRFYREVPVETIV